MKVKNISKKYGRITAIQDVSFEVKDGEIVGYVGLNGAGKTTTIEIISGVRSPDQGDVEIDGHSIVKEKRVASKNLGWVPELPIFEQDAKALDYFIYLAGFYGISTEEARRKAQELFSMVGLEGREKDKLKNYSQGMKKRFALAVSMLSDPKNFLFDEVLNGLDPQGIAFFRDLAIRFKKEGKGVLFSSHILTEVENIADRVIFIHKGRIMKEMTIDEIRNYAGSSNVRVILQKPDDTVIKVAEKYGIPRIEGNTLYISDFKGDMQSLFSDLAQYGVNDIGKVSNNLEEIFFKIIGLYNQGA
ncbi:ABC transporter ATP-binding protein [Sulfolobus acidocaldarius SUSAZ]|nr:ABC transporter ATP-binding protein [Sulfolobus acidocaldarius SUSAZ]